MRDMTLGVFPKNHMCDMTHSLFYLTRFIAGVREETHYRHTYMILGVFPQRRHVCDVIHSLCE